MQKKSSLIEKSYKSRRFSRSLSRSHSKSSRKQTDDENRMTYLKNIKLEKTTNRKDLEGTTNFQKMIKQRIMTTHNKQGSNQNVIPCIEKQNSNLQRPFQGKCSNNKQNIQKLIESYKINNSRLQQQNDHLSHEIQLLKKKVSELQRKVLQIQEKSDKQSLISFINDSERQRQPHHRTNQNQDINLKFFDSYDRQSIYFNKAQQATQNSIISLDSGIFSIDLQNQLYQAKQKINLLMIELNCQKRKHFLETCEFKKKKDEEIMQLKKTYSTNLTQYKQRMKKSFTLVCQQLKHSQLKLKKKSSIQQLNYSFQEEQC